MSGNSTSSSSFSSRLRRLPVATCRESFRLAIGDRLSCKFDTGGY